jgi:aspartate racemase
MKKIVGIIGGMGPEATVDLVNKIIHYTDAQSDQEHIHMVIDNNTSIKDRSNYIINNIDSPEEELIETAVRLENYGVDFIAMPCNTAHYFYESIDNSVNIPVINMIEETALYIKKNFKNKNFILLATEGTYKSNIYKEIFRKLDLDINYPNEEEQKNLMKIIYDFKSTNVVDSRSLKIVVVNLEKSNSIFILGCTELPVIFKENNFSNLIIDPTEILARSIIREAGYKIKDGE